MAGTKMAGESGGNDEGREKMAGMRKDGRIKAGMMKGGRSWRESGRAGENGGRIICKGESVEWR